MNNLELKENIQRLINLVQEDPGCDIEDIRELVSDTQGSDLRGAAKSLAQLSHAMTDALIKTKRSVIGISILAKAITKIQQHSFQLTQLHSDYCLLCLDAKCLNPALEVLDIDYTEIRTGHTTFIPVPESERATNVKHVVLFYYYGGLIYAAVKNFDRASFYFEVVLTIPANVSSPIMQETYKKFILVNILLNGKLPESLLPKYTSQCVLRQRKQLSHSYIKFAQEYQSLNQEKIHRVVTNNLVTFERDENMGLIRQCLSQLQKRNIQRLKKTFLKLSLRDIANHAGFRNEKEAELYMLNMIDDGEISATISQMDGMVVFHDNKEKYASVEVFHKLQKDIALTTSLIYTLKKMDPEINDHKPIL